MDDIHRKVPSLLTVTLYNYNYLDNRIVAALKNYSYILKKSNTKIAVPADELFNILRTKFAKEIEDTSNYPQDRLAHGMNTAFQLYHLLSYYTDVKAVTVHISMDKDYSKVIDTVNELKLIALDYKIDKGLLRYDEYFSFKELAHLNNLLRDIDVIKTIKVLPYYTLYTSDYLERIENLSEKLKEKYKFIIEFNNDIFIDKMKMDNPLLMIVTDHLKT